MNFNEFWIRQQYTDLETDKMFAKEVWDLATNIAIEECAMIAESDAVIDYDPVDTACNIASIIRSRLIHDKE